jgi:putative membrane protein
MMDIESRQRYFRRWAIIGISVFAILVAATILSGLFLFPRVTRTPFYYFFPFFPFGFFFFAFLWIFIIFGVLRWFFWWPWGWGYRRRWGYYWGRGYYGDDAYQILRERYAKGEITKDQFEQMSQDLDDQRRRQQQYQQQQRQ